jgi:hypothetical protein
MGNKLQALLQVLVIIARDMFIGLIFGLTAAVLMVKLNPHSENIAALLVPTGIIAGILKGFSKFLILKIYSSLPTKGYRFNYPKYKLLFLWLGLLLGTLLYAYGLDVSKWFAAPHKMLLENKILGYAGQDFWTILIITFAVIGTVSYLYEPPYNNEEFFSEEDGRKNNAGIK